MQRTSTSSARVDPERAGALLARCVGSGPRYTSYPTAPVWSEAYGPAEFERDLGASSPGADLSLYVHVPFCRSLCHFCACNRVITRKPELPARWLDAIERELERVRAALPGARPVVQHHWGGGTPTHLDPEQVRRLFRAVNAVFPAAPGAEISLEVDPRVTGIAHLEALRECGFNRISLGVQDFSPRVQAAIQREQSPERTGRLVESARRHGFESVNLDLIYGLPFQTLESTERTLAEVIAIAPDRIALYGYAHVTWVAKQQRGFARHDLPDPALRLRLLLLALRRLLDAGYVQIGMDHFARPGDALALAARDRTLRRNFMGYTTRAGVDLLGFGPSAISELAASYAQSARALEPWHEAVAAGRLATLRGHRLSRSDLERRWVIGEIMCHAEVRAAEFRARFGSGFAQRFPEARTALESFAADGVVELDSELGFRATELGRLVLRNLAMLFDAHLPEQRAEAQPRFSQTV